MSDQSIMSETPSANTGRRTDKIIIAAAFTISFIVGLLFARFNEYVLSITT